MPVVRLCFVLLFALLVTGCASAPSGPPIKPNMALLAPAEQALEKARAAHVTTFAPRALDAARGRLALARDILYIAARQGRRLNDQELERVTALVEAARLDAHLALVKTQAMAVGVKLNQMQHSLGGQTMAANGDSQ